MRIVVSNVDTLMAHPVCDCRCGEAHINQKRNCAVTNIVNSDTLYPCLFRAPVHLPMQIAFGDGEHPVVFANVIEHFEVVLHFIRQELRHSDDPVAFLGLRRSNQVLTVQPLVRLTDGNGTFLKIEVRWSEGQQFPFPDTTPIEHLKSIVGERLVHHGLGKFQILRFRPKQHLPVFLLSHASGLFAGIVPEVVVADSVIEDGAQLIVNCFQIDRGVRLAFIALVVQHLILPGDDLLGRDIAHLQLAEVGQQLGADDVVFGSPGVFFETGFHIRRVLLHEAGKGHVQIRGGFVLLLPLPRLGIPFSLEPPLLRLLPFAGPVGVAVDHPPGAGLFFFVDRHYDSFLSAPP